MRLYPHWQNIELQSELFNFFVSTHWFWTKSDFKHNTTYSLFLHAIFYNLWFPITLKVIAIPSAFLHFITSLLHFPGAQMIPISWCEMQCPRTHSKEFRKVARVQPEYLQAWEPWNIFIPQGTHSFPFLFHLLFSQLCFRCIERPDDMYIAGYFLVSCRS